MFSIDFVTPSAKTDFVLPLEEIAIYLILQQFLKRDNRN